MSLGMTLLRFFAIMIAINGGLWVYDKIAVWFSNRLEKERADSETSPKWKVFMDGLQKFLDFFLGLFRFILSVVAYMYIVQKLMMVNVGFEFTVLFVLVLILMKERGRFGRK